MPRRFPAEDLEGVECFEVTRQRVTSFFAKRLFAQLDGDLRQNRSHLLLLPLLRHGELPLG